MEVTSEIELGSQQVMVEATRMLNANRYLFLNDQNE